MAEKRVTPFGALAEPRSTGTPVLGNACASTAMTPDTVAIDGANYPPVDSFAQHVGSSSGKRSVDDELMAAAHLGAQLGEYPPTRDERDGAAANETLPVAEITADRPGDNSAGQVACSETSSAESTWPEEAELLELVLPMLTGGSGTSAAPATQYQPAKATYMLLVRVKNAVATLKKEHGGEMHMVPGTNGRIDQQEGRGYLLGAVLGRGLLTREQAKAAGLDARNKLTALDKRLFEQKEAARRTARKLRGEELDKHTIAARTEREAIERERIELDLPPPPPPPKPRAAAGRKRVEPAPPPQVDPLVAWCGRHEGWTPASISQHMSRRVHESKRRHRAWNPRGHREVTEKARALEVVAGDDDLCTCGDGVPSILCRVSRCFATAAGAPCDERVVPGCPCDCMGWEQEEMDGEPPLISLKQRRMTLFETDGCMPLVLTKPPPPPIGGWPVYDAKAVARAEREEYEAMERMYPNGAPVPSGWPGYRRPELPPAPSAGVPMGELIRLYREHPAAMAEITATCARQDLAEAQKMAEIQRIVREV